MDDRQKQPQGKLHIHTQPINCPQIPDSQTKGTIRIATAADLKFVTHLQRKFSNQIGFLPTPALDWYINNGCISLSQENDTPAGYILGRPALHWQPLLRPIIQACVAMDAQRRHHGLELLAQIEAAARTAGQLGLQANCAADLAANEFWKAAGFIAICQMSPSNARKRDVICWRKPLAKKLPLWFAAPPQRAGYRAHHARIRQRKQH